MLRRLSVVVVWVAAAVAAVVIGLVAAPEEYVAWVAMAAGGSVLATLGIQLAVQRSEGFVSRVTASLVGALIVLAVATAVLQIVAAATE